MFSVFSISFSSVLFGVNIALYRFKSLKSYGCWHKYKIPSASNTITLSYGMLRTNFGKNFAMYLSAPSPGPITHAQMSFSHFFITLTHESKTF
jgi:hypothetical protein